MQKLVFLFFIAIFLFGGCAKIVAPTGGPKDEEHPLIVESKPANYSTNFNKKEVNITFNEFIQLKDLNSNLIVSPPVNEKPIIKVKGKTLNIKFEEDFKDSTTYNIYFGNSVQDFNEGNPIEDFQYVFSTGGYIDSLSIEGKIVNAFNLLPEEGVYVAVYNNYEDSVPLKQIPRYLGKTNKDGFFKINNIRNDNYKMFCLRDLNKNYLFDLPDEDIAFADSLIHFDLITKIKTDTIYKSDSLISDIDSTIISNRKIDTIISQKSVYYPTQNIVFRLFKEDHIVQYLANNKRDSREKVELMFNKPIKDSISIHLIDTVIDKDWYIKESNLTNDTIFYWITDSSIYNKDELKLSLLYQKEDSNLVYQWQTDTLKLKFFEPKKKRKDEVPDTLIKYTMSVKNGGVQNLNKNIQFDFSRPISNYDESKINLFAIVDTLEIPVKFNLIKTENKLRELSLITNWSEDTTYILELYPKALTDIYNNSNDTTIISFKTQKRDYYGKVIADIIGIDSTFQLIAQLILPSKDKENVYQEKIIKKDQKLEFPYLPPKEFIFKVILDKNFNNKWDTGEYLKHIQPEEVLYYDQKIKVRSNWDIEINFDVNKK